MKKNEGRRPLLGGQKFSTSDALASRRVGDFIFSGVSSDNTVERHVAVEVVDSCQIMKTSTETGVEGLEKGRSILEE